VPPRAAPSARAARGRRELAVLEATPVPLHPALFDPGEAVALHQLTEKLPADLPPGG
jgi:hypothetical protein